MTRFNNAPIDNRRIDRFEAECQRSVPDPVRWFLLNVTNGGCPQPRPEFPISGLAEDDRMPLMCLYGIDALKPYIDLSEALRAEAIKRLLGSAFPLGYEDLNGHVWVVTQGPQMGQVVYTPWDELGDFSITPQLYTVCADIAAFARIVLGQTSPTGKGL